jgi:predicted ribosome quality control (RQC) complex YloA/Tae2 family protein
MDTFVLNALVQELHPQVCPARIQAVRQSDAHTLILDLWKQGTSLSLAMSVAPQHQYIFLTTDPPTNQALAIGKFLQHHLKGSEIRAIHTPVLERIVTIDIVKRDIDGQPIRFQLLLELMGRHSNLILLAHDTRKILESLRRVTAAQSAYRRIAPGAVYAPPPDQDKLNPTTLTYKQFCQLLQNYAQEAASQKPLPLWKYLVQHLQGLSPILAKDLAKTPVGATTSIDPDLLWHDFSQMMACVTSATYTPHFLFSANDQECKKIPVGISAFPLQNTPCAPASSMLQAADHFYHASIEHQKIKTLRGVLLSPLRAHLLKLRKKRKHLQEQQTQIEQADTHKRHGDLLTAHLHQLRKGMREATVADYYADDQPAITIPLDPKLTPAQNAQRYFKRYSKLKQGQAITQQRLQETEKDIAYLEEWIYFIESADTLSRLHELRQEVEDTFERPKSSGKPPQKSSKPGRSQPFLRTISSDGFEIYIGRSSKENDILTQRTARSDDIWLHVQRAPGSHVLILYRDQKSAIPDSTLREAAALAAYHSKLREAGKVEVMYTSKKYVKKPKGAPPGLVTVSQYRTILVTPQAHLQSADSASVAKK